MRDVDGTSRSTRCRTRTCTARRSCRRSRPAGSASTQPARTCPRSCRPSWPPGTSSTRRAALPRGGARRRRRRARCRSRRSAATAGLPRQHMVQRGRDPRAGGARPVARLDVFISLPVAERTVRAEAEPLGDLRARERRTRSTTSRTCWPRPPTRRTPTASRSAARRTRSQARAAAKGQFTTLLLGLGAVALLVGAIGIANIMVISVLERRGEIGLRRALGATRRHIAQPSSSPSPPCSP